MKTQVIMKRELFGKEISQQSKTEFFSGNDLVAAGNLWRQQNNMIPFNLQEWLRSTPTKAFIAEIEKRYGVARTATRGRTATTWLHPLLFIDAALAISPELKLEVYEWLFDHLIKNRNDSGDSYKEMCGYLYANQKNKQRFQNFIASVALKIQKHIGVSDWQQATEEQLMQRDKIHDNIAILAGTLRNNDQAVRLGLVHNAQLKDS